MTQTQIRILIVDDQGIIRHGLKSLLEIQPDLKVVGEAANGKDAIALLTTLARDSRLPDLVLLDVRMPIMDGVATTKKIAEDFADLKVLILTTFDDDEYVSLAMSYGAKGYLLKDSPPEDIALAIRSIYRGHTHLGPGLFDKVFHNLQSVKTSELPPELAELSPRETDVLELIATGANNREIANHLYISEKTVKNHVTSILSKLNLRDRTQAAIFAHNHLH